MTEDLDTLMAAAFKSEGKQEDINKVYLAFLRTSLFIPVKKEKNLSSEEPFSPLFAHIDNQFYMSAFSTIERLQAWSGDQFHQMDYVSLIGHDLTKGIDSNVFLCLNIGTEFYKEFSPDEIKHLKKIVSRIEGFK